MCELLSNNSLFVVQLYEDKSLTLRACDLIFFTTDLQTVNQTCLLLPFLRIFYDFFLRITIAKLRTEPNPDFLSTFIHFGSFQVVFSLLKGGNFFADP